jgi:hypothetical protein
MAINNTQLAELMIGMAKTNVALAKAASPEEPLAVVQRMIPAMQAMGAIQGNPAATLSTIYARMALMCFGTPGPQVDQFAAQLNNLLGE